MFRYLLDLKEPGTAATALGRAFHETIAHNFRQEAETSPDPLAECPDCFRKGLGQQLEEVKLLPRRLFAGTWPLGEFSSPQILLIGEGSRGDGTDSAGSDAVCCASVRRSGIAQKTCASPPCLRARDRTERGVYRGSFTNRPTQF